MKIKHTNVDNTESIGKYFKEIRKKELLTFEKEIELAERVKNGDEDAVKELCEANLRFVVSVAKEYQGQGLLLNDLINEGNYGLIKAAHKFDVSKGYRFISYAVWWIRQSIIQSLNDNSRIIRLPVNLITKLNSVKKHNLNLMEDSLGDIDTFDNEFVELNEITCNSLNDYINEDGDEVSDLISDDINIEEKLINNVDESRLKDVISKTLDVLDERERCIIECYFGLNKDYEAMTLEGIGDKYNLTKERIRQIKNSSIRKLRANSSNIQKLLGL